LTEPGGTDEGAARRTVVERPQRGCSSRARASCKENRDVYIRGDDRVYEATSFISVLSMPILIEELVPRIAAAADGEPDTSTDQQG
jgi:hypothetical protein